MKEVVSSYLVVLYSSFSEELSCGDDLAWRVTADVLERPA